MIPQVNYSLPISIHPKYKRNSLAITHNAFESTLKTEEDVVSKPIALHLKKDENPHHLSLKERMMIVFRSKSS